MHLYSIAGNLESMWEIVVYVYIIRKEQLVSYFIFISGKDETFTVLLVLASLLIIILILISTALCQR